MSRVASKPSAVLPQQLIPQEISDILGPPALVHGEDRDTWHALFSRLIADLVPKRIYEWILVRNVVDCLWDERRYRLAIAALINSDFRNASRNVVSQLLRDPEQRFDNQEAGDRAETLARDYLANKPAAVKELTQILGKSGIGLDALAADSLRRYLDEIDRIERMLVTAEKRRDRILLEYDRRRYLANRAVADRALEKSVIDVAPQ